MQYMQKGIEDFNLDHIFDCGQCFRWEREEDGSYTGTAMGTAVNMRVEEKTLIIDNCSREDFEGKWRSYLDLDRDYGEIKRSFAGKEIGKAQSTATEYEFSDRNSGRA